MQIEQKEPIEVSDAYSLFMTDKALFHRHGILVVRDEQTGEHQPLDK